MANVRLSVSQFIDLTNQTLEYAFGSLEVEGEVSSFKVNQGKYVFFDLKDASGSIGCFMTVWQLRVPIEDGMKVIVEASPKLTNWGKFSLTVRTVRPSGEGALKKSFELLKAKLEAEGLFAVERKRPLPAIPNHVAVISSTDAAGYADFIKILNDRWGGVSVEVAHVQVQGAAAPDQIIRALQHFNTLETLPEVIVIVRGGGSADDLAVFNDEQLVRAIAGSRVPTLVGVGHEVDVTLADLAADVRAATPSNAAQLLVPDRHDIGRQVRATTTRLIPRMLQIIDEAKRRVGQTIVRMFETIEDKVEVVERSVEMQRHLLAQFNPETVLARGYALMRGETTLGATIEVELSRVILKAEVKDVREK
ncbi:MAG: exodeoxyribonuclease large subunit [Candidatus Saccharibacteria bacterium]|nr:exodeoxyribonuclease large subunit [Candidatus Saccharibacteria bacterium]